MRGHVLVPRDQEHDLVQVGQPAPARVHAVPPRIALEHHLLVGHELARRATAPLVTSCAGGVATL